MQNLAFSVANNIKAKMKEYTFTFNKNEEARFKNIMSRLEPYEFEVVEPTQSTDPANSRCSELKTVVKMDPEAASTFRFGMKDLKIRRKRTAEEIAEEEEREKRNTITINVKVDGLNPTP
jgi:hypothetical protein